LQYYAFKNSIAIHRSKAPYNMGTLLWQLNDCWPVASWSITDYSRHPKAAWYAVKEAYRDDVKPQKDLVRPIQLNLQKPTFTVKYEGSNKLSITSDVNASYVYLSSEKEFLNLSDNYFDLQAGKKKMITINNKNFNNTPSNKIEITSLYDVVKK
jgi:beta-mannosidase